MCGIIGYIGKRKALPILINGLKTLEYRGYDSAGVALIDENLLEVIKEKGKVSHLEAKANAAHNFSTCGIAHTRWATHGEPSVTNAHPHTSMSGELALVHNGIIENYQVLKEQLMERGYVFQSSTDTEVLVQLIDYYYQKNGKLLHEAVSCALNQVIGAYAIAVLEKKDAGHIIVARKSSPLVVGIGEENGEFFIASDATPIVGYTTQMVYLDDEQIADVRIDNDIHITSLENQDIEAQIKEVHLDISRLSKGGFEHFMLKEIFDQPEVISDCMRGRVILGEEVMQNRIELSSLRLHRARIMQARHITIVACGTSWHAALIGKQLIEHYCRKRVVVEYASEYRYSNPVIDKDDIIIAISQSGETADTLAAISLAEERGALVFGIVNAVGSSIARKADTGIYIHVGPEIGVASTKAFTGQVTVLTMFALQLGHLLGTISDMEYAESIAELAKMPDKMRQVLMQAGKVEEMSKLFTYAHNFLYLGRGYNYPVALEGALKLKEISYIHAEGYPAAEMKHGPIALVDADMPIIFIATHDQLYEKAISNLQEVKSRGGRVFAVVTEGDEHVNRLADSAIHIPSTLTPFAPLLSVVPLQLLAYYVAVRKGLDVDQPRNLAKSVTVE